MAHKITRDKSCNSCFKRGISPCWGDLKTKELMKTGGEEWWQTKNVGAERKIKKGNTTDVGTQPRTGGHCDVRKRNNPTGRAEKGRELEKKKNNGCCRKNECTAIQQHQKKHGLCSLKKGQRKRFGGNHKKVKTVASRKSFGGKVGGKIETENAKKKITGGGGANGVHGWSKGQSRPEGGNLTQTCLCLPTIYWGFYHTKSQFEEKDKNKTGGIDERHNPDPRGL